MYSRSMISIMLHSVLIIVTNRTLTTETLKTSAKWLNFQPKKQKPNSNLNSENKRSQSHTSNKSKPKRRITCHFIRVGMYLRAQWFSSAAGTRSVLAFSITNNFIYVCPRPEILKRLGLKNSKLNWI